MDTVTISPKFQVVIPKSIREKLKLSPGQKVQAIVYGDRIELIPLRPIKEMRGFLLEELLVPSLTSYKVFKRVLQQRDEGAALQAMAVMQQGAVVDLNARLALSAASLWPTCAGDALQSVSYAGTSAGMRGAVNR